MSGYIDFHSHAFPNQLAATTIPALEKIGQIKAALDGTTADLLHSMDRAGIAKSVLCSIATRPSQFQAIFNWSQAVASDRLIPLASVHPDSANPAAEIRAIAEAGLKGIKMHPYYQDFYLGDPRLVPIFKSLQEQGLLLVLHCGYDIGFADERRAVPEQLAQLIDDFPELKLVAAHLGSWQLWHEVSEHLLGQDIYLDLAFSLPYLDHQQATTILTGHRPDRLLFGSDSPWADQQAAIDELRALGLASSLNNKILEENGSELLASVGC